MPGVTAVALIVLLGAWACVSGILLVVAAAARRGATGRGWLAFAGIISLIWGAFLLVWPGEGSVALVFWRGLYALIFGFTLVVTSVRVRREHRVPG